MKTNKLFLSLGTNLGDRQGNISMALDCLCAAFGKEYEALSPIVTTKAVGFDGFDFLNCIVQFSVSERPEDILRICKDIEHRMGRNDVPEYDGDGHRVYHNRIIDIDILIYGDIVVSTPELTVPHPQVKNRPFIKELLLNLQDSKNINNRI